MRRGTTPTITFKLPFPTELIKDIVITFAQNNTAVVEKRLADCTLGINTVSIAFSQEDTLKFTHNKVVQIQAKIKDGNGNVAASDLKLDFCHEILNEEIL